MTRNERRIQRKYQKTEIENKNWFRHLINKQTDDKLNDFKEYINSSTPFVSVKNARYGLPSFFIKRWP